MDLIDRIQPAPVGGGFAMEDWWVWDGSVIRGEDGLYHMFASRWPKSYPFFNSYIVYSEIVRAVAQRPEGPYEFAETVLRKRGGDHWDGRMTHNPGIRQYKGKYLLYYIGSTFDGPDPGREELLGDSPEVCTRCYDSIRIGLATADSVKGPWEVSDEPILLPRAGRWDSSIVTNPAPCILDDGSVFLIYRSNTPDGMRLGMAKADSPYGGYRRLQDAPVLVFPGGNSVEDPFLWWEKDHFELMAKDMTGGICGELFAGIHARSDDGTGWRLCDPPKAYSRRIRWSDGSETVQGCLERPGLLMEGGRATHLVAATGDGRGGFDNATKTWTMVVPLK